ncbi:50S ribosomal protein L25 [Elusimicrobiota bacterium]
MKEVILEAELRDVSKKSNLKTTRSDGKIPCVFYGKKKKTIVLSIDAKKFGKIIEESGSNVLCTLKFPDDNKTAIVKEIQRDMISQVPIHVDFQSVSLKEKVEVSVPLHIEGTAPGVKLSGGILEHLLREITISCLPKDMPKHISLDVSKLELGNAVTVGDLPKQEGIEIKTDPKAVIVNVVIPKVEEEKPAEEVVEAGAAEPEVITKGKKEEGEEGAEGAPPAKAEQKPKGAEEPGGKK